MAMEAEKAEESSKRLEMSVSISQDALEVEDEVALEEVEVTNFSDCRSPSPDLASSSPNLYCRQIALSPIFSDFQSAGFPLNFD